MKDPLDLLRDELRQTPLPAGFVGRVRRRVEADAHAAKRMTTWLWIVPLVSATAVLVAVNVNLKHTSPTNVAPVVTSEQVRVAQSAPAVAPAQAVRALPKELPRVKVVSITPAVPAPVPEVITHQAEVLQSLWAARRSATATVTAANEHALGDATKDIVVAPIEVPPLVMAPMESKAPGANPAEGRVR